MHCQKKEKKWAEKTRHRTKQLFLFAYVLCVTAIFSFFFCFIPVSLSSLRLHRFIVRHQLCSLVFAIFVRCFVHLATKQTQNANRIAADYHAIRMIIITAIFRFHCALRPSDALDEFIASKENKLNYFSIPIWNAKKSEFATEKMCIECVRHRRRAHRNCNAMRNYDDKISRTLACEIHRICILPYECIVFRFTLQTLFAIIFIFIFSQFNWLIVSGVARWLLPFCAIAMWKRRPVKMGMRNDLCLYSYRIHAFVENVVRTK